MSIKKTLKYDAVYGGDPGAMGIFRKSDGKLIVGSYTLQKRYHASAFEVAVFWSDEKIQHIAEIELSLAGEDA